MNNYVKYERERLTEIELMERENIHKSGKLLAEVIDQDRLVYVFGAGGHSSLVTGEMFFRIGGLANIYPISEYGLTAFSSARKFIALERCQGLGSSLVNASGIGTGDVLLLFHTIGVNATCIEAAKEAKRLGAKVIGVASNHWQDETAYDAEIRSVDKENIRDIVDIYIDDHNTVDDAEVELSGMKIKVGPLSNIITFSIAHMIEIEAMKECLKRGITPPVWANENTPEGAIQNKKLIEKFSKKIPML